MYKSVEEIFAELETHGILAKANFMCCMNCGCGEIREIFEKNPDKYIGYVFFHEQDQEEYERTSKLNLRFGSNKDSDYETVKIGELLCNVFKSHEWNVDWNGIAHACVIVKEPTW